MSQRTRGSETTAQVVIDGNVQASSWAKVLEWTITPKQEITNTGFQGELEDDFDFQHMGYGFDMSFQELDGTLRDVLLGLVNREQQRAIYPDIHIVLTIKHRAGTPTETLIFQNVVFKFDSIQSAAKKDFLSTKITGSFRILSRDPNTALPF